MAIMRCTFAGCEQAGVPEDGYDFFVCEACCEKLESSLIAEYEKRLASLAPPAIVARVSMAVKL